jgi:hypothetical protein
MRRKIKRGRISDEQWEKRVAELRPIFTELEWLNDNACAVELNRRGVPALGGGVWKGGTQVERVRQRLGLDTEHDKNVRRFTEIRDDLIKHFGRKPEPPIDDLLIEYTAWCTYYCLKLYRLYAVNPVGCMPKIEAADIREYRRRGALLAAALDSCRIASDVFGTAAQKSRAEIILENFVNIAGELAEVMRPTIAAGTATKGTA